MGVLLIDGKPVASVDGLSIAQAAAVEAAPQTAPAAWHDGLVRDIAANLPGPPPWANSDVTGAISVALANVGLAVPFFLGPQQVFAGAEFAGGGLVAALGAV
jgi:hypothetical protein